MRKKLSLPEVFIFEWDSGNLEHIKKHKVTVEECEQGFYNEPMFFPDPEHSETEERVLVYSKTNEGRLITLVFTLRKDKIRVISARNQSRKERKVYTKT